MVTRLTGTFSRLGRSKVMVIGDFLLDTYTIGKARRISPEAPVAVLQVQREEHRPGGAGNVVLNLISMGCDVIAVGRIGGDNAGQLLLKALGEENAHVAGMVVQAGYCTPVKNRIIADNQQIVRVDHEQIVGIPELVEQQVIEVLPRLLEGVAVVAISDYGKGFLSRSLLDALIATCRKMHIPIVADPKGIDFAKYGGATVIKPNLSEAYAAAGLSSDALLDHVAAKVLQLSRSDVLMITRAEAGLSLFYQDGRREDFPVRVREVKDVTGAGDTVLAMLTCAMANGLSVAEAAQLSNVAAGIAIERFGCARVSLSEVARRLLEYDVVNKVFDEEHLFALQEALRGHQFAVLGVSGAQGLTTGIFSSIRQLALRDNWDLLVFVKDSKPEQEFVNLLASLHDVDFILVNGDSLRSLCKRISPDAIYEVRGQACERVDSATTLVT
jgi:D-beta-D-heptose 7-phosphate kinase/D-beta-D-heptose 1-phosphate adenosyltransferase